MNFQDAHPDCDRFTRGELDALLHLIHDVTRGQLQTPDENQRWLERAKAKLEVQRRLLE